MFEQSQIQEFKEAFSLMDQDRDGTISVDDLKEVYNSLGRNPKESELKAMISEAEGPINFTMLLTLFGDRLNGTDEESMLMNAFKLFDKEAKGVVHKDSLRDILVNQGKPEERLSDSEVKLWYDIILWALLIIDFSMIFVSFYDFFCLGFHVYFLLYF